MNTQTKAIIKSGLFSGIVYAGLMAGFDYSDGQDFKIWKFIFHASFFGIFMALMTRYNLKKQANKEKNKTE
ncbi:MULTISPECIES: hypothetical protein [unclassified Polaribacter]|uniref:hypothetical protein n=1 Tax=unclassified Polaribacter TaxID=196858 RepID=UPI0011BD860D|nr:MULTISPECIES: hypothetical protein [unclassified Polaribacter]TXD48492.1 hypothetical protein ES043_17810 [Polaribacter sp. IC063]TXD54834.1 hypothetical protein ES044_18305 [Polaribacter sp. IC066]